ncbi:MAG: hypothetical protein SPE10_05105 [Paludibacteraceae bacterium]|nr:hypothetical protein [Paludibacteraceae bacterium]
MSVIALSAVMVSCNKQDAQSEQKDEMAGVASQEVSALRVAMDLAKFGYETESPSALIEAANILASTPTQALEATVEQGAENANETEKVTKVQFEPKALVAAALELTENEHLIAMADNVMAKIEAQAEGTRGALGGPRYANSSVSAHSYTYYNQKFWADDLAEILVSGDGDTDLDLYVYDENGNLIVSDTDYTDDCYVRFYPRWTGMFRIKIVNRGGVYNRYVLITN